MPALRRLLAVLAIAAALVVSALGVASAGTWSFADPKGDVLSGPAESEEAPTLSPNRKAGDVWRTAVSHTSRNVVIRITMQAVPRADWMAIATIRTPRTSYDLLQARFGEVRGFVLSKTNGRGETVPCRAKSSRMIGTALQMVVSRRCLGNPSTVRVGAAVAVLDGDNMHVDDALRRGLGSSDFRYSPLIRRG